MAEGRLRAAWAEVDLDALAHNVALMRGLVAPARLCAVVKADGYGHGAVTVARAALVAGASWLAVALPEEGTELRRAGIEAPVLVLSEPDGGAMAEAVAHGLTPTLYRAEGVAAAARAARSSGAGVLDVHLKVDTGMHRVGAPPERAVELALAVREAPELHLGGVWTHLAVADEPADPFTAEQLARFEGVLARLRQAGVVPPMVHAANSAGAIGHPRSRYDLVRCGIALYGCCPSPAMAGFPAVAALRPVLSLRARVALVRELEAGERVSYGRRRPLPAAAPVATVPLGYADGVPRGLSEGAVAALVRGRRCLLAGTVTMDQLMLDCGPAPSVAVGDEVVLLGRQGGEQVSADDWAKVLGTISYEVLCGIGPRVPRVPVGGGAPGAASSEPGAGGPGTGGAVAALAGPGHALEARRYAGTSGDLGRP